MADQHRYDSLGFTSNGTVQTPNLDKIASEGMWFTNAFTNIPICGPSRQSLLNGRRAETFGALWNFNQGLPTQVLQPTDYTWPRALNDSGYYTHYFGKWGIHPTYQPTDYGYDNYIGLETYQALQRERYPDLTYQNGYFGEIDPIALEHSRTHWLATQVNEYLDKQKHNDKPWLMAVNFPEPHLPCRPTKEFAAMYDVEQIAPWSNFYDDFKNKPYIQRQQLVNWDIEHFDWEDWAPIVARYFAVISQMDDAVGSILAKLSQLGMDENTIVIYTADHGDMCGSHRMMDKHYILYDDIVHVPLVIRWPGKVKAGIKSEQFVYNMLDLPPTLLELCGIEAPDFFHGKSMVPILFSKQRNNSREWVVASSNGQQFGLYTQRMIQTRGFKYIWNTTDVDEFYDLRQDPDELVNQIGNKNYQTVIDYLRKHLYQTLLNDGDGLVMNHWLRDQLMEGNKL